MMNLRWIALLAVAGCGNSGGTADMPSGNPDMSGVMLGDMSMAMTGDLSMTGGAPDCVTYCTTIMANCTGDGSDAGMGANAQYTSMATCLASCKAIPVGTLADKGGNTLGCRSYHATAAKNDPVTHCPHAGPGGAGVCGDNCDGYCQIAMKYCTAMNMAQIYTDLPDCMATCNSLPDDVGYSIAVTGGNHRACLLYHVQEASVVQPDHCNGDLAKGDGGIKSVTCTP